MVSIFISITLAVILGCYNTSVAADPTPHARGYVIEFSPPPCDEICRMYRQRDNIDLQLSSTDSKLKRITGVFILNSFVKLFDKNKNDSPVYSNTVEEGWKFSFSASDSKMKMKIQYKFR